MKKWLCVLMALISVNALADTRCGPYKIFWNSKDGFARVNGERPENQKVTFLKKKDDYGNVKIQWMLPDRNSGRWVGMDFIARDGKPILNVEGIRMNMDEPRIFGTYDCMKSK